MTEQIKYKIGEQEVSVEYDEYGSTRITRELLEDLIKGRCMWEEVLQELKLVISGCDLMLEDTDNPFYEGKKMGYLKAIEIIKQKLSNLEE